MIPTPVDAEANSLTPMQARVLGLLSHGPVRVADLDIEKMALTGLVDRAEAKGPHGSRSRPRQPALHQCDRDRSWTIGIRRVLRSAICGAGGRGGGRASL
ncbi:hypothetical protein GCM10017586_25400 [Microbacterium imperiale]|uniref:MarR family transcriptional regulator n=1 Tax=Microbacterium imperiale TaxID=33884 RepID=A0A9W6HIC1_9MICO|nr:hypothetical protein GCM10017544_28610 [Microbacterium imperiale]GLJ80857.1 hypothetical protein GCM10017586_25400 [Microbacterium imperiale]